jgi:hypothetical protein
MHVRHRLEPRFDNFEPRIFVSQSTYTKPIYLAGGHVISTASVPG